MQGENADIYLHSALFYPEFERSLAVDAVALLGGNEYLVKYSTSLHCTVLHTAQYYTLH